MGVAACGGRLFAVGGDNGSVRLNTAEAFDPRLGECVVFPVSIY